ncbi:MAG: O-antigen ligase family protein [Bacteroidota bacterium]|nr:O-antigen ligase family protein [Candidatus Kapabacteria bacterium]MDW8221092.1 O-antigen ligase family protein [Bacteroidota bacterium]
MAKQQSRTAGKSQRTKQRSTSFFAPHDEVTSFQMWMLIPLLLNPILLINSLSALPFSGMIVWTVLGAVVCFFTIRAPWTLIAANPLYIMNGIHTVDFYIKAVYIATVFALTFLFTKSPRKENAPLQFTLPEILWLCYMVWGAIALLWSYNPVLGYERLLYLTAYGIGAYILGKQTQFWKSRLFWDTFAATALVVGVINMCMYFLGDDANLPMRHIQQDKPFFDLPLRTIISFDWIMSAGRPSSTLAFRAYAATYLSMSLPFLAWYMFSKHVQTVGRFIFAASAFGATAIMLFHIRARSGWISFFVSFGVLAIMFLAQKRWKEVRYLPHAIVAFALTVIISFLPPSQDFINKDTNPQKLKGTSKEYTHTAFATIGRVISSDHNDRFDFWSMSRRIIFEKSARNRYEHPFGIPAWILGVGIGQFPLYVPMYTPILHNLGAEIHNDWMQSFLELGPIGFICWNGFMLSLLYYAWRERKKGIMYASIGGILAWVFVTQTDFATPRIYAAVWVGGMAAMICTEAGARPLLTINARWWQPWFRQLAGVFYIWVAVSWGIMMWCDRQIYIMLTKGEPLDIVTDRLFGTSTGQKNWNNYNNGFGKYLIFSPISDMQRAIQQQTEKLYTNPQQNESTIRAMQEIEKRVLKELLIMHPHNYQALGRLSEINFRQGNYKEALDWINKYIDLKRDDFNLFLFRGQSQLELGDSLGAAKSFYRAVQLGGQHPLVQDFWQRRLSRKTQEEVIKLMQSQPHQPDIPE